MDEESRGFRCDTHLLNILRRAACVAWELEQSFLARSPVAGDVISREDSPLSTLRDFEAWLSFRLANAIKTKAGTIGPTYTDGYSYVEIPEWEARQKLDNTQRALATLPPVPATTVDAPAEVLKALQRINDFACYSCEENPDPQVRYEALLKIGNLARNAEAILSRHLAAAPAGAGEAMKRCTWTQLGEHECDGDCGPRNRVLEFWATECGRNNLNPPYAGSSFCPFCGKNLESITLAAEKEK